MPLPPHALALTLLGTALAASALAAQAPVLRAPLPPDQRPFNDDIVCQSPYLERMEPAALRIMNGEYEFESLALSQAEEAEGDLWAQFNYPKTIYIPGYVGIGGLSGNDIRKQTWRWKLTLDKDKLTMKNFLFFSIDIPDEPYELASEGFCVGWKNRGFYMRGTTAWDGSLKAINHLIVPIPGPVAGGVGTNPLTLITMFPVCYSLTGNCWESAIPGMRPRMVLGRGMPVSQWEATRPGEAMAATEKIYGRSRWAPLPGGNGAGVPTDGDGEDAFPFTTYDIEAVGGLDAELDTRVVEVCRQGTCVRESAQVFVLRRIIDGTIRRRFYNDPRLGFLGHYPGGQEFQAFFTAGDKLQLVSGAVNPSCTELTEQCFLLANPTPLFVAGLIAMKELCGTMTPCGARWGRPKDPINAEVVIEGTDDSLRFAAWCRTHQGTNCNDSTANPLDGRDVLVKIDSLNRMEDEVRRNRARPGYINIDTAGTRSTLSGERGANVPRAMSEAERLCRVQTTRDSLVYVNGPILETEDRRLRQFNADSAFASCQAEQATNRRGGTPGAPGRP